MPWDVKYRHLHKFGQRQLDFHSKTEQGKGRDCLKYKNTILTVYCCRPSYHSVHVTGMRNNPGSNVIVSINNLYLLFGYDISTRSG